MDVTRSNSGLFITPGFIVSPVVKRERGGERKEKKPTKKTKQRWEGEKKEIGKEERKEGRRNKERSEAR